MYLGRKLLPREQRYATVEKECLAIVWVIQSLKVYLYGYEFIVETDHHALHWLDRMKEKNGRLTQWSLALQTYSFTKGDVTMLTWMDCLVSHSDLAKNRLFLSSRREGECNALE